MRAIILGNGPNLQTVSIPLGAAVLGVNRSYELFPDHDIWVTSDGVALAEAIRYFEFTGVWPDEIIVRLAAMNDPDIMKWHFECPVEVRTRGGNSGEMAMQVAALRGYKTIYLAGFDPDQGGHFYGDGPVNSEHGKSMFRIIEAFPNVDWRRWGKKGWKPV